MARTKANAPDGAHDFEKAIARLEEIVRRLEEEEISLEASLLLYEEGLKLQRACESRLQEADNRIKQLVEAGGGAIEETDFEPESGAEADSPRQDPASPPTPPASADPASKDDLPF
jgi:exodeoxyribonuclease VII small subunit